MFSQVKIKNFRGLSEVAVDLSQTTVLIGPNSCGKTTVLQAVQLVCTAAEFARQEGDLKIEENGWLSLYPNQPIRDDQPFLPTARWTELFLDGKHDRPIVLSLHFSSEHDIDQISVKLERGRASALRMTLKLHARDGGALRALVDAAQGARGRTGGEKQSQITTMLARLLPTAVFIPAFYGVVAQEEYLASGAVRALLQSGQQGQVVRNLLRRLPDREGVNTFLLRAGILARLESHQSDIETARYLEVLFSDRNGRLELSSAGTGLISLLALYSAIQQYGQFKAEGRAVIFLIDEPEAHLHPQLQGELAARLSEMMVNAGSQLLCATHSVEMINRFGRDERSVVLRIARDQGGEVRLLGSEAERMADLADWCDLSPFAKLNLLASRRIAFFEGTTDETILSRCASVYLGADPSGKRLAAFRRYTFAPLSGISNRDARDVLKTALLPLFQHDKSGPPLRVVRLLDRDYQRKDKPEKKSPTDPRYEELDVEWSHDRSEFVLRYVRDKLLAHENTKAVANRIRSSVAKLIKDTKIVTGPLLPPSLIPEEIKKVLDYMAQET